ncbi:MAG: hypothetical protein NC043_04725 [Muribaculaceae bacterium]|nr:hypothetical protein [Muribaculaceae bacterium]
MKKILLGLALVSVLFSTACTGRQSPTAAAPTASDSTKEYASLKEAYDALSTLPNMTIDTTVTDSVDVVKNDVIDVQGVAAAYGLDSTKIYETGNAMYAVLDRVPLADMINGANNGLVSAFIYASPIDSVRNEILIATASGYNGAVVAVYGTTDNATVSAIRNAPLTMQGATLNIALGKGDFLISLTE